MRFCITVFFCLFSGALWAAPNADDREYDTRTHVVQPKETLYKISRQYGVSVASIRKANKLTGDNIAVASRLIVKIPKENDVFQVHIVRVSEDLAGISDKYLLPMDILTKYNEFDENVVFPGQRLFIKIDKINTKYTYKGEEDQPLTDAEAGETHEQNATPTNYTFDDNPAQGAPTATAGKNNTPVYVFNTTPKGKTELKDSNASGDRGFMLEGYADIYFARFSDRNKRGELNEYAMGAPRHNQVGLNTAQLAGMYNDTGLRANITLQMGDLATAAYPADYKFLQQANIGFSMWKKLWVDAGFFRSPVSVEDFPAKSNFSSIYSYARYFEPVLWSGAKLGYEGNGIKITGFVADRYFAAGNVVNTNISYGLNLKIYSGKHWLLGGNAMFTTVNKHSRFYGNIFAAVNQKHLDVLGYANYGTQQNKALLSGVLNIRYKFTPKFSFIARAEYFNDSSGIVSPLMTSTEGKQQGLSATAISGGFEIKARANHYLRFEARNTRVGDAFKVYTDYMNGNTLTNQRWEFVITTGIWFGK